MSTLQPVSKEMCVAGSFYLVLNSMEKETISLKVVGRNEALTFHLGVISVADDTEYMQRFVDLADLDPKKKAAAEFDVYVDAIAAWSVEMPTKKNGSGKDEPLGKGSPSEAIKAYFSDRSNSKQWLAVTTINAFRNSLYPKVTFQ
jgi:hypothetical protein